MEKNKPIRILSLILAACLIFTLLPPISSTAAATEAQEPQNVLRVGIDKISGSFSPLGIGSENDQEIVDAFTGHLLGSDREGNMILNGMEGETRAFNGSNYSYNTMANCVVTQNQDGTVDYDLTMRDDIKFSDGVPATIDDVIFSLYVMADPSYDGTSPISALPIEGMEAYRADMQPRGDVIFADGPDGYVENTLYTAAQYIDFWNYYTYQSGIDFAQEIIDFCVTNYLAYAPDYIGATEEEVLEDVGLQVKLGMTLWGFGNDWFEGADAADFWTVILSYYDSPEEAEEIESAGSTRLELTKRALGDDYAAGVSNGIMPRANFIYAAGPDGYVANDLYTEAQYNAFWTYYNEQAGTDFAQEIIDYCVTNYLDYAPDYIGATQEQVLADVGLQVKLGMTLWGFGDAWFEGATAADFWDAIVAAYDSVEEAEAVESAGSDRLELTKRALGAEYQICVSDGTEAASISGVIKTGDYSLRIHCDYFDVNTIYSLDLPVAPLHHYGDVSLYDYEQNSFGFPKGDLRVVRGKNTEPLGCGPYVFSDYSDGVVTLTANPFYYKGEPKIETLQYQYLSTSVAAEAIVNDQIDLRSTDLYIVDELYEINSNHELSGDLITAVAYDHVGFGYVGINAERVSVGGEAGSQQSKNLRLAIMTVMAVCRDSAIASYYDGFASVIQYPISNSSWAAPRPGDAGYRDAYSTDVNGNPIYTDGMTEAQRYQAAVQAALGFLEAAGYTVQNGRVVAAPAGAKGLSEEDAYEIMIPGGGAQDHPAFGIAVQAQELLSGIGFALRVSDLTIGVWNTYLNNNECDLWAAAWQGGPDPDMFQIYHSVNANGEGNNYYQIQDDDLDALILEARSTANNAERKTAYREALEIILSWGVELPTYQRKEHCLFSTERVNISTLPADYTAYWGWMDEVENLEMNIHAWDDGVTVEPTCTEDGSITYTCTVCGQTKVEILPALGHAFELGVCTRCGYEAQNASEIFTDVDDGKYYAAHVLWAIKHGITSGTGDGTTFSPNQTCTRAQVMTFLWKAFNSPEPASRDNPFYDVKPGKYYELPVLWAYYNDPQITGGMSETSFGVNKGCTRAQVVTFLWKAAGAPEPETTNNPFNDVKEGKYYYSAVLWAVENGITSGMSPDRFGVNNTCTRAQVVTFLHLALGD